MIAFVIGILASIGLAIVAYLKGQEVGVKSERTKAQEAELKARQTKGSVEAEVDAMTADEARKELSRWDM